MFGWLKGKNKEKYVPNLFQGVDLNKWAYLGYARISYHDENKVETMSAKIMFFCAYASDDPDDLTLDIDTRKWVFSTASRDELFRYHQFIDQANLWRIGENDIFQLINPPSQALKEYMLENYDSVWSTEKNWWVQDNQSVEDAKYKEAVDNQKKPDKIIEANIVKVNFKK